MDKESIAAALGALAMDEIVGISQMAGGTSPVYKIDFAKNAALVLKSYPDGGAYPNAPDKDAFAAAQLTTLSVPVSRHLLVDSSKHKLPFRFAVTNYLAGATADTFKDHAHIASLYRQMGRVLRELHAVGMPAYGSFDGSGIVEPVASNVEYVRGMLDYSFVQFAAMGAEPLLAERLRAIVERDFAAVVPQSRGAVFAHDDFHPNNVLAIEKADGTLVISGLIDFGNARAADAVSDLAKCLFCCEHEAPGSTSDILDGYGPIPHPNPDLALKYYTLLHRMVMWWYLRQIGVIPTPETPSELIDVLKRAA